jgi:hypothetical protein
LRAVRIDITAGLDRGLERRPLDEARVLAGQTQRARPSLIRIRRRRRVGIVRIRLDDRPREQYPQRVGDILRHPHREVIVVEEEGID